MSSKAKRRILIGLESTPGDGATVDVALRAVASLKAMPDKITPEEDVGSFAYQRHFIGSLRAEGSLEFDAYYEHAPYPISMGLGQGGVSSTGPEEWIFALPVGATPPTFATYNVEYTDGNNHIVKAVDVFATDLEISGEAGGSWMITSTLTGANVTFPAAVGASPTPPLPVTPILMAQTTLKFADGGDLDGASPTGVLISFTWKLESLLHSKLFAGALYPTGRGTAQWKTTLELIVEIDNAVVEAQKDKLLNTSQTYIRVGADAPDAGGAGIDWKMYIDGTYFLQDVETLDERDGNNTVKLMYTGEKEPSVISPAGIYINNNLAAL